MFVSVAADHLASAAAAAAAGHFDTQQPSSLHPLHTATVSK